MYKLQDRISGTLIDEADTLQEAIDIVSQYIRDDIADGNANDEIDGRQYTNDFDENGNCFYEIIDENGESVEFTETDLKESSEQ